LATSSTTLGASGHEHYRNWFQNDPIRITIGDIAQIQSIRDDVFYFRPCDLLRNSIYQLSALHVLARSSSLCLGIRTADADDGPNMLWYGGTLTTILIAGAFGIVAIVVPEHIIKKIPLWLVWLFPILAVPYVVYSLMPWWTLAARQ
jgi:hypothetical protein